MGPFLTKNDAFQSSDSHLNIYTVNDSSFTMTAVSGASHTVFAGIASNEKFFKEDTSSTRELLVIAVNNRTRERNYFRLYSQLLDGEISEDDFNREIEENENRYVICTNNKFSADKLKLAADISKDIMDIDDVDDFLALFSIDGCHADKLLEGGKNG